jgi:hypothetical protein
MALAPSGATASAPAEPRAVQPPARGGLGGKGPAPPPAPAPPDLGPLLRAIAPDGDLSMPRRLAYSVHLRGVRSLSNRQDFVYLRYSLPELGSGPAAPAAAMTCSCATEHAHRRCAAPPAGSRAAGAQGRG